VTPDPVVKTDRPAAPQPLARLRSVLGIARLKENDHIATQGTLASEVQPTSAGLDVDCDAHYHRF
jgi:hypothetical protein